MRIYQEADYMAMSRRAANLISTEVIRNLACVLGLATGSTPVGTYKQLAAWNQRGDFSFKEVQTVNLDENKGLAPTHDQSYRYFMQTNLFDHIDIDVARTHVPDGLAADPNAECARYDELVRSLGYADLQLLGLGRNGHIGFNEPCDNFVKETHVVDLTESTIEANARFFASVGHPETLAGSVTSLMGCLRQAVKFGIPLEDAVRACTYNPAQSIDIDDRAGTLDTGKEASFVLLDKEDLSVRTIVFKGNLV